MLLYNGLITSHVHTHVKLQSRFIIIMLTRQPEAPWTAGECMCLAASSVIISLKTNSSSQVHSTRDIRILSKLGISHSLVSNVQLNIEC